MIDLNDPETKRRIFDNINQNYNEGNGSRYSKESKIFAYSLFMRSQSAYNYLRQVYPFPCEKTLYRNFRSKVDEHSQILTKTIYANKRFDVQKNIYKLQDEKIDCVLCVDAFAGTVLHMLIKNVDIDQKPDDCKHVFIFLVCPLNTKYKPFIIHLKPTKTGNANQDIDDAIQNIQKSSMNSNFPIKYIAVDGDSHYSKFFKDQFDKVFDVLCTVDDFDALEEAISDLHLDYTFITDPLHIWKNFRARLIPYKIVVNPFKPCHSITSEGINQILRLGPILPDKSQIAKMRDEFAVGLFNLDNASRLLNKF